MGCEITKINKGQKISAFYVKYVLFILEKTKQKGSIDPFGPFRVNSLLEFKPQIECTVRVQITEKLINCFKQNYVSPVIFIPVFMLLCPAAYAGFWKRGGGGGGKKLQKIGEEHKSEFEIVTLKFRPIFRPKSGKEHKKKVFTQISSHFRPKLGEEQKKKKVFTQISSHFLPKIRWFRGQSLMPNLQRGGYVSIFSHFSEQFCNHGDPKGGGQWPNATPKYAPAYVQANRASIICAVRCVFFLRGMLSYQTRKVSCLSFFG